ncbi:MAG: hypothetical protein JOY81_01875 [Alphaproteobacteria bacterium]|nr:hypothetical protein [Alphaproteobacteria bacterium]
MLLCSALLLLSAGSALAQTVDMRQWRGDTAITRQPGQVFAQTNAEWRSLWSRVGLSAPDQFEAGRTMAVGIFLGSRTTGYAVHILSAMRRRDRIMLIFEEQVPEDVMMAQRMPSAPPPTRSVSSSYGSALGFAAPGTTTTYPALPPPPARPVSPPTSPWAIVLLGRADMPVTVEQRLFR